jgi:uncharacterized repeat protein (TIGR01451 family)
LNPSGGAYASGTTVTLTPVPSSGYQFSSWTGTNASDIVNTAGVYTIVMNGDKSVTANFTLISYTLTAGNDGHGTVTLNPTGGTYTSGTTVTLTPVTSSGYQFSSWSGTNSSDIINTAGVYTIVMNGNKSVTANFTQIMYTLTAGNDGHGTVTLNPTGGTYASGTTVTLTPVPSSGYQFSSWAGTNASDVINSAGVYTIVMNGNKSVTANFTQSSYTLTAGNDGHGTVTLNPTGGTYASGTTVTLTPVPSSGYQFSSWTGTNASDVINTAGVYTIVMNGDKSVTANFTQITYTMTAGNDAHGTVTLNPTGGTYTSGTTVTLTPVPNSGYQFSSWTGTNASDIINTAGVYTIVMNGNKSVTANFTQIMYTLTAGNDGHGTVTLNPTGGTYASGTTVTLTPVPSSGYQFGSWSGTNAGDIINTAGVYTIVMNGNKSVTVNFTQIMYTLTAGNDGHGTVTLNPTGGTYTSGATVILTPVPSAGYQFTSWTGTNASDIINTEGVYTIVMNGNKSVMANFSLIEYTLTVSSLHGSIVKSPNQATYHLGNLVQIAAVPDTGWSFASWSGDTASIENPVTIVITGNLSITANYIQNGYTLTVTSPHGTVTRNPNQASYRYNDVVQLTAVPEAGWSFTGWSGDVISTTNPVSVTINGNKNVTANYIQVDYNLSINVVGNGSVVKNPDTSTYHYGDVVNLSATAASGWRFAGWSGDTTSSSNPLNYTIVGNAAITATFLQNQADLQITHGSIPATVIQGDEWSYTLTVANLGPNDAINIKITDLISAKLQFVSASGTSWVCNQSSGVLTCSLPTLASGTSSTVTVTVKTLSDLGVVDDEVVVSSGSPDPILTNNTTSVETLVVIIPVTGNYLNYLPTLFQNH